MFLMPRNRLQSVSELFFVAKCHFWPLLCQSPGMRFKKEFKNLLNLQSNRILGVEPYLVCAEKSIASDFKYLKSMLEPLCAIQVTPIVTFWKTPAPME